MSLFNLPQEIKINGVSFNKIELKDRKMFEEYLANTSYSINMWNMNFTYMFTYGDSNTRGVIWKKINDMLCVFCKRAKGYITLLTMPLGECDIEKMTNTLNKCFSIMDKVNETDKYSEVHFTSTLSHSILDLDVFKKLDGERKREYVYDVKRVASLEGSDFSYIRRKINKFHREYPEAIFRECKDSDYDKLLLLQKLWEKESGKKYFRIVDSTYYRSAIKNRMALGHKVFVVEYKENIIGMISGQEFNDGLSWCFLRKPLAKYDGLSELLIHEMCVRFKKSDIMNDGTDGQEEGLRFFKERFRPLYVPNINSIKSR